MKKGNAAKVSVVADMSQSIPFIEAKSRQIRQRVGRKILQEMMPNFSKMQTTTPEYDRVILLAKRLQKASGLDYVSVQDLVAAIELHCSQYLSEGARLYYFKLICERKFDEKDSPRS